LQQENQQLKLDKTLDFKKLEIQSYEAETKRITALNQDRGTETPPDMAALTHLLDGAQALDEHDIQRAQLEHSVVMDHAKLAMENKKLNIQQEQNSNSHELAMKQASMRPASPAPSGGSKTSRSGRANG
jgi:hypothetical protein